MRHPQEYIKKWLSLRYGKKRTTILVALFVVICTLALTPYSSEEIRLEVNKAWNGSDIIAEFDFAIKKPEDSLSAERERIRQRVYPIYSYDPSVYVNVKNDITKYLNEEGRFNLDYGQKKQLIRKVNISLDSIYATGIRKGNNVYRKDLLVIRTSLFQERKIRSSDCFTLTNWESVWRRKIFPQELIEDTTKIKDILSQFILPDILYNDSLTKAEIIRQYSILPEYYGKIETNTYILRNGEIISPVKAHILRSYLEEKKIKIGGLSFVSFLSRMIIVLSIIGILLVYLRFNRIRIYHDLRKLSLILFTLGFVTTLMGLSKYANLLFENAKDIQFLFMVPTAIVPVIISSFFDSRTSSMANFTIALIVAVLVQQSAEFALIQAVSGTVSIYSLKLLQKREVFFYTLLYTLIAYISMYLLYHFCFFNSINTRLVWIHLLLLLLNVALTVFAYPLIYLMEKIFKISSALSYFELLDTGHPLLQQLSSLAPGTFQHSLQVANIAKTAAIEIEANALLTYVGALFHDVGKIKNTKYFIENFRENENPHTNLKPEESAEILLEHVTYGIAIAKKHKLPKEVIDFIETHHGTTKVEFFYRQYLSNNSVSPDKPNEAAGRFSYKGPKPFSKETALVMIADSVEAASRALKVYSVASIENLVNRITDEKISNGQLNNSNLTFRDITIIRKSVLNQMVSIYHSRIEYPQKPQ